ncbi:MULTISPECIES: restriction endonuclease subunit S [unclassified Paraflavitalea]|uniref:restriction endonuclease subunit S n=1 Tax=unclassified Paraflavitalea TaxID=2798305 RepID=UPI003D32A3AD
MSEWKEYFLAEIAEIISNRVSISKANLDNYISTENLIPNFGGVSKSESIPNVPSINSFNEGDTLFSNIRTYFKKVWYSKFNGTVSPDVLVFRSKPQKCTSKFLYYLLCQPEFTEYTVLTSKGAKMPRGDKDAILNYKIAIPSIATQTAIASILSSLDDKIDLLHRQNATLEKMAETLFRQWFVEEAKEDWEEGDIYNFVDIVYGFPFKSKHFNEERRGKPLIRIRDLKDGYSNIYTDEEFDTKYILKNGDLVAGMDGEFRLYIWSGIDSLMNQRTCKFIPKNDSISNFFIFSLVKPHLHFYEMTKVGTTVIHLGKSDLDAIKISIPPPELVYNFGEITNPWFEKLQNNNIELLNLKELREILLPKLMSGEITIKP